MDKNSLIDRNTFVVWFHAEDNKDVFICDKAIANAVSLFNKKGYKTFASCSGHYKIEFCESLNVSIDKLKEYQNNDKILIKRIREDSFDCFEEIENTLLYVLFEREYKFDNLPDGFCYRIDDGEDEKRSIIESVINYYDIDGNHRSIKDVVNEIERKCKMLEEYARGLDSIK